MMKIVIPIRVKNEQAWITQCLNSVLKTVAGHEYVVVCLDDGSTDQTAEIVKHMIPNLIYQRQNLPLDEVRDKNWLHQQICQLEPDWVISIDGDEQISDSSIPELRSLFERSLINGLSGYGWYFAFIWKCSGDQEWFRTGKRFWPNYHPRMWNTHALPGYKEYRYSSTHRGGFHCGSIPSTVKYGAANILIKHYGYATKELRDRKYRWYSKQDPTMNYQHLAEESPPLQLYKGETAFALLP